MKWVEIKIIFDCGNREFVSDLISNLLFDLGLKGAVIEDPGLEPIEGWGDDAANPPEHDSVIGFLPEDKFTEEWYRSFEKGLKKHEAEHHFLTRVLIRNVHEEDWAESWKVFFGPEKICGPIVVKPTWKEYEAEPGDLIIEIDPGMAFGTGTHPTTTLCISMILKYLKKGNCFLDIGTGSGILMIAASKLGAGKMLGLDSDDIAVNVAKKNMKLNLIPGHEYNVLKGNLIDGIDEKFDLVVANILSDVIMLILDRLHMVLKRDGIFVCSGILDEQKDGVIEKIRQEKMKVIEVLKKESWVAIACKQL